VSRIVLGSVPLSKARLDESLELIAEYVRLGGNAIDTAHIYGPERHEIVGEFLRAHGRDSLILMDKCCHPMSGRKRVTRQDLISDLCENQSRMGIERTDFFVLHRDDPEVPAGQVIDWMNEQLGRIAAFGASNWSFERIREGNEYAAKRGLQGFSMSSVNLALAFPQDEMWKGAVAADREARTWHEQSGLPLFSWSAGAAGFFAGVDSDDVRRVYRNESNLARKARVEELAPKLGASPAQLALAWVLNQPMNSFAIIGPRSVEELREGMAAAEIKLAPEQLEWLEKGE
jgi:aryl-alcohol dehydrogenase-like predicted oxidoreductase